MKNRLAAGALLLAASFLPLQATGPAAALFSPDEYWKTELLGMVNKLRATGCRCGNQYMPPARRCNGMDNWNRWPSTTPRTCAATASWAIIAPLGLASPGGPRQWATITSPSGKMWPRVMRPRKGYSWGGAKAPAIAAI